MTSSNFCWRTASAMLLSAALLDMMPDVFSRLWRGNELCTKNRVESERNTKQRMDCSITRPGSHGRFDGVSAYEDSSSQDSHVWKLERMYDDGEWMKLLVQFQWAADSYRGRCAALAEDLPVVPTKVLILLLDKITLTSTGHRLSSKNTILEKAMFYY